MSEIRTDSSSAQVNQQSITLSFCLPTYNNEHSVERLVKEILTCNYSDIEIVVLDNASSDNTVDTLNKIDDNRLKVFRNKQNMGALYNMVNVLEKGTGKILVYSTDHDHVDPKKIDDFKNFIRGIPDIVGGYCLFKGEASPKKTIFSPGPEGIKSIAYLGRHPTGYFFNREALNAIKLSQRFSNYDFVDLFPLEFAFAELCLVGRSAIYNSPLFFPETGEVVSKRRSSTTKGVSDDAFFSPKSRLKLAVNYTSHLLTLEIGYFSKLYLAFRLFFQGLFNSTFGYKVVLNNRKLCLHYGMPKQLLTINDLMKILNYYCRGYLKGIRGKVIITVVYPLYIIIGITLWVIFCFYRAIKTIT